MRPSDIIALLLVAEGGGFKLAGRDPKDACGLDIGKNEAEQLLATATKRLSELQERLYAEGRWAILATLQGPDTSGKDGVIKSVFSGVNPQGCEVHSFKQPSALELDYDFLWRTTWRCRRAAASAFSIALTMKRPWSCVCIRSFSTSRICRRRL
jgi:polyphosphate kinase 2 (PPK2 family)